MSLRAMWSGTVSWGLVTIPVKLAKAASEEGVRMHQLHKEDGGRVHYRKVCEACEAELDASQIGKGAELATGATVALSDDDLASLPLPTIKEISVDSFATASEIDPMAWDQAYYIMPGSGGARAYRLLHDALTDADKVGIVRIAIRSRESLAMIAARDGFLLLVTLYWPAEVRQPEFRHELEAAPAPSPSERQMAGTLIEMATAAFDPDKYSDRYSEAVRALVDGRHALPASRPQATTVDLATQLKASLDAAKPIRKRTPRKKTAAKGDQA